MDFEASMILDFYVTIRIMKDSEKSRVELVEHKYTHQLFVMKVLSAESSVEIYRGLKLKPVKNTPIIFEVFIFNGKLYIVEEYISGESLEDKLKNGGRLAEETAGNYIIQLSNILNELHTRIPPIIHRDIKPGNIIIMADGTLKLIDFDISREYKQDAKQDTHFVGTDFYMAPEQYGGAQTDRRTDIFAVGRLIYALLTGNQDINTYSPEKINNPNFREIVINCTKFNPEERYASVNDIKQAIENKMPKNNAKPVPEPANSKNSVYGKVIAGLIVCIAFAMVFSIWMLKSISMEQNNNSDGIVQETPNPPEDLNSSQSPENTADLSEPERVQPTPPNASETPVYTNSEEPQNKGVDAGKTLEPPAETTPTPETGTVPSGGLGETLPTPPVEAIVQSEPPPIQASESKINDNTDVSVVTPPVEISSNASEATASTQAQEDALIKPEVGLTFSDYAANKRFNESFDSNYYPVPKSIAESQGAGGLINNMGLWPTIEYITKGDDYNAKYYLQNASGVTSKKTNKLTELRNDKYSADIHSIFLNDEGCVYLLHKKPDDVYFYTNDVNIFPHIPAEINMGDCINKRLHFQNETAKTENIEGTYVFISPDGTHTNEIEIKLVNGTLSYEMNYNGERIVKGGAVLQNDYYIGSMTVDRFRTKASFHFYDGWFCLITDYVNSEGLYGVYELKN